MGAQSRTQLMMLDERKFLSLTHNQEHEKQQIFSIFTENALECLSALEKACANDDNELWLMATGQLSSLAGIIGAQGLEQTVGSAAEIGEASVDKRQNIAKIRTEFERLRRFMSTAL